MHGLLRWHCEESAISTRNIILACPLAFHQWVDSGHHMHVCFSTGFKCHCVHLTAASIVLGSHILWIKKNLLFDRYCVGNICHGVSICHRRITRYDIRLFDCSSSSLTYISVFLSLPRVYWIERFNEPKTVLLRKHQRRLNCTSQKRCVTFMSSWNSWSPRYCTARYLFENIHINHQNTVLVVISGTRCNKGTPNIQLTVFPSSPATCEFTIVSRVPTVGSELVTWAELWTLCQLVAEFIILFEYISKMKVFFFCIFFSSSVNF